MGLLPITTYNRYRNKLNKTLNLAKRNYFFKQFAENLSSKQLWNKLNKILKPCKEPNFMKLKIDNVETEDSFDIGNILNDFFLSPPTPSKISSYDPLVNTISNPHNLFLTPTTPAKFLMK